MKIRHAIIIVAALAVCSCNQKYNIKDVKPGEWYRIQYKGQDMISCIDERDENSASGKVYFLDEFPYAQPHIYAAEKKRNTVNVWVDNDQNFSIGKWSRYTITKYEDPEYDPSKFDQNLFLDQKYEVKKTKNIIYGHADGYYDSLEGDETDMAKTFVEGLSNSINQERLNLTLDLYQPDTKGQKRPLIMFIHGGAFLFGDKSEPAYQDFCNHFASLGYTTASINYRLGFLTTKSAIQRAGYRAVQDANAAMRFLVHNSDKYGIDTTRIFVAGSSAGGITALNMAFMTDSNKPESVRGGILRENLGGIDKSGNRLKDKYTIKAVASMWGALNSLDMLSAGHPDLILFHGTEDQIIPFANGLPFAQLGDRVSSVIFDPMYGSKAIQDASLSYDIHSKLKTFYGCGHALNVTNGTLNANHYKIRSSISEFFRTSMIQIPAYIEAVNESTFCVKGNGIGQFEWKVDGGFIVEGGNSTEIKILWCADAPERKISACGSQAYGIGFEVSLCL